MNFNDYFLYDGKNIIWKERGLDKFKTGNACNTWNTKFNGKVAGSINKSNGYLRVAINSKSYLVHRIVWEMNNGKIPDGMQIDHINHDRTDNRLCNMRLVTGKVNAYNQSLRKNNTSGVCGVSWDSKRKKWVANIKVNGKFVNLGRFDDRESAAIARASAENEYGFHINHGI